jgi:hypothetical protein
MREGYKEDHGQYPPHGYFLFESQVGELTEYEKSIRSTIKLQKELEEREKAERIEAKKAARKIRNAVYYRENKELWRK